MPLGAGVVGAGQVGRAADHRGQRRHQRAEREFRGAAGGDVFSVRRRTPCLISAMTPARRPSSISPRSLASNAWRSAAGIFPTCAVQAAWASRPRAPAARQCPSTSSGSSNAACVQSRLRRAPAISSGPSGVAVRLLAAGLAGRPIADGGAAGDQRRAVGPLRGLDRSRNGVGVVAVNAPGGPSRPPRSDGSDRRSPTARACRRW